MVRGLAGGQSVSGQFRVRSKFTRDLWQATRRNSFGLEQLFTAALSFLRVVGVASHATRVA